MKPCPIVCRCPARAYPHRPDTACAELAEQLAQEREIANAEYRHECLSDYVWRVRQLRRFA